MPHQWHRVWKKIKSKTHKYISMPLILADWFNSSDNEKRERFEYHLNMAKKLKVFEEVKLYLNSLNELDWFHKTE